MSQLTLSWFVCSMLSMRNFLSVNNLPNSISALGVIVNIFNIWQSLSAHNFVLTLILLNIGIFLDLIDGYIARKIGHESKLGATIDTINDVILYLLTPMIIIFNKTGFGAFQLTYILVIFSGIWRLNRFLHNGLISQNNKHFYVGVPVYFNLVAIPIIFSLKMNWIIVPYSVIMSWLMVSNLKVFKFGLVSSLCLMTILNVTILIAYYG